MRKIRKRINVSVDADTYDKLHKMASTYRFHSVCELVLSFMHILLDRMKDKQDRQYDLPEPDGEYIDSMFEELGHVERTPDGTVPVRHKSNELNGKG